MKRLALLSVSVLAISFTACGSSDGQAATAAAGDQFCTLAQTARDDEQALENMDPTDADALKVQLSGAIDSLTAMAAKAPKDISDTVNDLLDSEENLETLLKKYDYDFAKLAASDEGKKLQDDDEISKNGDAVDAYLSDKCGIVTDDTVATDDTIVTDDTVGSDITIDLGEGEDAINKFLDFYELGTGQTLTDEQRSCIIDGLKDVSGDELNEAITGNPSEDVKQALGLAFINCEVDVES